MSIRSRCLVACSFFIACSRSSGTGPVEPPAAESSEPATQGESEDSAGIRSAASQVPSTDIYLARLSPGTDGNWELEKLRNVTAREGYDNQPAFSAGATHLYYTSVRDGQADIYVYDLAREQHRRWTDTPVSEFSPTPHPSGHGLSLVREEAPQQWLWHHGSDGVSNGAILENLSPVGYHAWLDADHVAMFVVDANPEEGGGHRLVLADLEGHSQTELQRGIGRCLQPLPSARGFSFTREPAPGESHTLWAYDLDAEPHERALGQLPPGVQDYAWLDRQTLIVGSGAQLQIAEVSGPTESASMWRTIVDLSGTGLHEVTRIAVADDGRTIAIVDRRPAETEEAGH